jgi:hypothetical protein
VSGEGGDVNASVGSWSLGLYWLWGGDVRVFCDQRERRAFAK